MVKPALESWSAASVDGSTRVGSAARGRSKAPTRANTSPPGACSASRSSAARKNCSRPDAGVTKPLSGGFQFEQIPAAVEPAGQQALLLLQLRHLARELVDIGVQEIEAVAGEWIGAEDLLEHHLPLVLTGELGHLFLDPVELSAHVGGDVAQDLHVDVLRLFDDHRRTPSVKSGALRSG